MRGEGRISVKSNASSGLGKTSVEAAMCKWPTWDANSAAGTACSSAQAHSRPVDRSGPIRLHKPTKCTYGAFAGKRSAVAER